MPKPQSDCAGVIQTMFATFYKTQNIIEIALLQAPPFIGVWYLFVIFPNKNAKWGQCTGSEY